MSSAELQTIKQDLKKWESCFYFTHRTKPTKDDIAKAPQEIKDLYKKYARLKRNPSVLKQNNDQVEEKDHNKSAIKQNIDDVWGKDLNKSASKKDAKPKPKGSIMQNIGQKLLARSNLKAKVSSPALRRKENFNDVESLNELDAVCDDPVGIFSNALNRIEQSPLSLSKAKFSKVEDDLQAPSSLTIQTKGRHNIMKRSQQLKKFCGNESPYSSSEHMTHDTDKLTMNGDIVERFERSEMLPKPSLTSKTEEKFSDTKEMNPNCDRDVTSAESTHNSFMSKQTVAVKEKGYSEQENMWNTNAVATESSQIIKQNFKSDSSEKQTEYSVPDHQVVDSPSSFSRSKLSWNDIKASKPNEKAKEDSPDRGLDKKCSIVMKKARGRKRKVLDAEEPSEKKMKKSPRSELENVEENGSCVEWESDIKPVALPENFDTPSENDTAKAKTSSSRSAKKSSTVRSSGNFVRLNMKVKRYSRGKGGNRMTGERFKRMKWKNKMSARSQEFGANKCYKCGKEGHWANKCRGPAKPKEKELSTPIAEEEFPSLTDAFNMARGISSDTKALNDGEENTQGSTDESKSLEDELAELEVIRTAYEKPVPPQSSSPLLDLNPDGSLPAPNELVMDGLAAFGFSGFRPGQEKAIMRILCGQSTLVMLSTGAGKSLCYQLPAYLYAKHTGNVALVISPLISLMEDQVANLPPGINGACLHTNLTPAQKTHVTSALENNTLHFLLVSPEALEACASGRGFGGLRKLPKISFACIDEAHCVSEWSHHFRPSYLRVCKLLRDKLGVTCLLGLTATATMTTAASISRHLGIEDYQTGTIRGTPVPQNLLLSASRDEDRDDALINLLQGDRYSNCSSIIIYCTRRQTTERVAVMIRTCLKDKVPAKTKEEMSRKGKKGKLKGKQYENWDAEAYHAGLTAAARKRTQAAFMSGRLRIVVATVAFGMGLDKADVRGIIHYNLPKSYESYVQEIGRAGRDGLESHCHVFLDEEGQDLAELKKHSYSNTVDRVIVKKLVQKVFKPCKCKILQERLKTVQKECTDFDDDNVDYSKIDTQTTDDIPDQSSLDSEKKKFSTPRVCSGHERMIPIEDMVKKLDMKEEGILTLLFYMELHQNHWVETLSQVYSTCTLKCYGGPQEVLAIAKKCPAVAAAIALEKHQGKSHKECRDLEFKIVDVCDAMGWESNLVKKELKMLEWDISGDRPRRTSVMVEFSDLAYHLRSPGDLTDEELDSVIDFLYGRLQTQESTEMNQLHAFHSTILSVAHKNHWMCADKVHIERSNKLKAAIRTYFEEQPALEEGFITPITFSREDASFDHNKGSLMKNPDAVRNSIASFIQLYGHEHALNGRVIARIFHGIPSPNFPSEVWGRVRRFWRCHLLDADFNLLKNMATRELIKMK